MQDNHNFNGTDPQNILNTIVLEHVKEQKHKRRWRWLRRIFGFLLLFWIVYQYLVFNAEEKLIRNKPHVGIIDINGPIFDSLSNNAENFIKGLDSAYKSPGLKAVILRINSPGGSPVQADYIFNNIQFYRKKFEDIKVYAVCVDLCASAAYNVAAAADEIYASPVSLVGSIGVIYNGFGFTKAMEKLGIDRRLETAGVNKGFLDPFSPADPNQQRLLQVMLDNVHKNFISQVKKGRGDRLKENDTIFSGLFWTGTQALEYGLIDGFASSGELARNVVKVDAIVNYTYKMSLVDVFAKNLGVAFADHLPKALGLKQSIDMEIKGIN